MYKFYLKMYTLFVFIMLISFSSSNYLGKFLDSFNLGKYKLDQLLGTRLIQLKKLKALDTFDKMHHEILDHMPHKLQGICMTADCIGKNSPLGNCGNYIPSYAQRVQENGIYSWVTPYSSSTGIRNPASQSSWIIETGQLLVIKHFRMNKKMTNLQLINFL